MTKAIALTRGKFALVDDEDYDWLMQWKWNYHSDGYATRMSGGRLNRQKILMHRVIMNAPDNTEVDHINDEGQTDGLDNRRRNLRICLHSENQRNRGKQQNNTSGFKGVSYHVRGKRWYAQIQVNSKKIHVGYYDTPEEAARAYDKAAKQYFGEFTWLNFPDKKRRE